MTTLRQEKRITIEGCEYNIRQLGALEGRRIWLKLIKLFVPSLKELASVEKFDERAMASALGTVIESIDDKTADELFEVFGKNCQVHEGERWPDLTGVIFDNHFAGRYLAMTKWLGECVVFNYAGFFEGISLGKMTDLVQKAASQRPSPTGSTGTSSESSHTNALP